MAKRTPAYIDMMTAQMGNYVMRKNVQPVPKKQEIQSDNKSLNSISDAQYDMLANTIISGLSRYCTEWPDSVPQTNNKLEQVTNTNQDCACVRCKKILNRKKKEVVQDAQKKACIFQSRQNNSFFLSLPYIENYTECNEYIGDDSIVAITSFECLQNDKMVYKNTKNMQIVVNVLLNFDIVDTKVQTMCALYTEIEHGSNKVAYDEQDFVVPIGRVHNLLYMGTKIPVPADGILSVKYELSTTIKLRSYNLFVVEV